MFDVLLHDIRFALRGLARSPGFAIAVVLTLGLAIGANSALFSVIDVLLFRPPAGVGQPERLQRLLFVSPGRGDRRFGSSLSYPDYLDLRDRTPTFSSLAAYTNGHVSYGQGLRAQELKAVFTSTSYMATLGVRPVVGSFFPPVDDRTMESAAVLGFDLWQRAFGGDVHVVGRMVRLDAHDYRIIGVAPRGFRGIDLERIDVILPLSAMPYLVFRPDGLASRETGLFQVVGRLADGQQAALVEARASAVLNALKSEHAADEGGRRAPGVWHVTLAPITDHFQAGMHAVNPVPVWLLGVTAALLLIACVNVANLLLARGVGRRRELAIRVAVGADRARLTRHLLVETAVLATLSAGLALLMAAYSRTLLAMLPLPELPPLFGGRVFLFTLGVSAATLLLAGVVPALRSASVDVEGELKGVSLRATARDSLPRQAIMAGQIALSLLLLIGAGLFLRSLHNIQSIDLGYDIDHTLAVRADLQVAGYPASAWNAFQDAALERLPSVPGVRRAALTTSIPARAMSFGPIESEEGDWHAMSLVTSSSPGYFRTAGIALLDGRDFTAADDKVAVAIVNRSMARRYWPGRSPIGHCFRQVGGPCMRIIGVVGDVRVRGLGDEPDPMYYQPLTQEGHRYSFILLRADGNPARLIPAIRRQLAVIDPSLPFVTIEPLSNYRAEEFAPWRMAAYVTVAGAGLALLLAIIGLYGVIAFLTAQRTREIGIRSALGASPRQIARLVLGEGARVAIAGCGIGVVTAMALGRLVGARLYGVSPTDPATYAAVVAVLAAPALLASYIPARRAARVDPTEALRAE